MDYAQETTFAHTDWKQINDPALKIGFFGGQDYGAAYGFNSIPKKWYIKENEKIISFITPSKQVVKLVGVETAFFSFGVGDQVNTDKYKRLFPPGVLVSYAKNGKKYDARYENGMFRGYFCGDEEDNYLHNDKNGNEMAIIRILTNQASKYIRLHKTNLSFLEKGKSSPIWDIVTDNIIPGEVMSELSKFEYTQGKVEFGLKPTSMNPKWLTILQENNITEKEVLQLNNLYVKIYELKILNPYLFDRFTTSFDNWTKKDIQNERLLNLFKNIGTSMDFLTYLASAGTKDLGYFEYLLLQENKYYDGTIDSKQKLLIDFITEFNKYIDMKYQVHKDEITDLLNCNENSSLFSDGQNIHMIKEVLRTMTLEDHNNLCADIRLKLIDKLLTKNIVEDDTEEAIIRVIETCPEKQQGKLLIAMFDGQNVERYNLIERFSAIDDTTIFIGENYYTYLMKLIGKYYQNLLKENNGYQNINNSNVKQLISEIHTDNEFDAKSLRERYITFNYNSITKRLLFSIDPIIQEAWEGLLNNGEKTQESTVKYDIETNKIVYQNYTIRGFLPDKNSSYNGRFFEEIKLHPLAPIVVDNQGVLVNMYQNQVGKTQPKIVPAVMLYFINEKANSKSVVESISTAIDLVSLAVPGGQATTLVKILNYMDKASSVFSLAGNIVETDSPEVSKVLNISSGVLGVSNITVSSIKNLTDITMFNNVKRGADYETLVNTFADEVYKNVNEIKSNDNAKKLQSIILEQEINLAQANGKNKIVEKLRRAKQSLENTQINFDYTISKYIESKKITRSQADELLKDIENTQEFKNIFKESTDQAIDAWLLFKKQNLPICK